MQLQPFKLNPVYRHYVWGGHRLRPGVERTAEAWIVHEDNTIAGGPLEGKTLAQVSEKYPTQLLGQRVVQRTGNRFPLLIKLLDCADWLSVQVHPDNEQALRLEGPGKFGKTEAWYIIQADPGAELICGLQSGISRRQVREAIQSGGILELVQRLPVHAGDAIFIPPGTVHALGPGLLLYEIQQTSDITYRVYDWDRPASAGRELHIRQSLEVVDPQATGSLRSSSELSGSSSQTLISCEYFLLEKISGKDGTVTRDTSSLSFHTVTLLEGGAVVQSEGWRVPLERFETLILPAECGQYSLRSDIPFIALRGSVL
jgi:mannose-6-phosphate isomerase